MSGPSPAPKPADVTLAIGAIHNPAEARHFMRLKPVAGTVCVRLNGVLLARSGAALRLLEVGKDFYDPVFYIPRGDILAELQRSEKTTHCPLKGDTVYFDVGGSIPAEEIAWSYETPFDFAAPLVRLVGFDQTRVAVEEIPG